eukprot:6186415-Pleurochrysis_carterae.AAC.5
MLLPGKRGVGHDVMCPPHQACPRIATAWRAHVCWVSVFTLDRIAASGRDMNNALPTEMNACNPS